MTDILKTFSKEEIKIFDDNEKSYTVCKNFVKNYYVNDNNHLDLNNH